MNNNHSRATTLDTFPPELIDLVALEFKPITLRTWLYLEKTGSPLVRGGALKFNIESLLRTLYVITQPVDEVGTSVRAGEERFAEAVSSFADRLPVTALKELGVKLVAHFKAELSRKTDGICNGGERGSGILQERA